MSTQLMDPSTYPMSAQMAAEVLRRPLVGHVVDGEHVESVEGGTMPLVHPTVPYGGFKLCGHGKMLGAAFVEEMTQVKSVWMTVDA